MGSTLECKWARFLAPRRRATEWSLKVHLPQLHSRRWSPEGWLLVNRGKGNRGVAPRTPQRSSAEIVALTHSHAHMLRARIILYMWMLAPSQEESRWLNLAPVPCLAVVERSFAHRPLIFACCLSELSPAPGMHRSGSIPRRWTPTAPCSMWVNFIYCDFCRGWLLFVFFCVCCDLCALGVRDEILKLSMCRWAMSGALSETGAAPPRVSAASVRSPGGLKGGRRKSEKNKKSSLSNAFIFRDTFCLSASSLMVCECVSVCWIDFLWSAHSSRNYIPPHSTHRDGASSLRVGTGYRISTPPSGCGTDFL